MEASSSEPDQSYDQDFLPTETDDQLDGFLSQDSIAECFAASLPQSSVNPLLKNRVMAATDPVSPRVVTDSDGRILSVSVPFTEMCGYSFEEIKGRKPGSFLQGPLTEPAAVQILRDAISNQKPCDVELWNYHKNGNPYRVRIVLIPVFGHNGQCAGYEAFETCLQPAATC